MKLQEFQVVFPGTVFKKITSFSEIVMNGVSMTT